MAKRMTLQVKEICLVILTFVVGSIVFFGRMRMQLQALYAQGYLCGDIRGDFTVDYVSGPNNVTCEHVYVVSHDWVPRGLCGRRYVKKIYFSHPLLTDTLRSGSEYKEVLRRFENVFPPINVDFDYFD